MSERSNPPIFKTLEFDAIIDAVADLTRSVLGRERIEGRNAYRDETLLRDALARVSAMQALLGHDDPFPLSAFPDFRPALARAETEGAFLDAPVFRELARFLNMVRAVVKYFADRPEKYRELLPMAARLTPMRELEQAIDRVVDEQGEVRDRASARLGEIRRELSRIDSRIRSRLDAAMRQMAAKGYTQEETLVYRQGRSLIAMKESHRSRLQGVVVDHSQSGGTVFMEPLEVVELYNRLRRLESEEKDEIERILKGLTDALRLELPDAEVNLVVAADFDALTARARFGIEIKAVPAAIAPPHHLELIGARHPLLLLKMNYEAVVPLSVTLDQGRRTVIITGPNAGGKTVALKTVGLLAMMHAHGLPVPADSKTQIPLFTSVYADIGDKQSIEQDLSTFSSHLREIGQILDHANHRTLVLVDEIGSATDPAEGSALAQVILGALTRRGTTTFATTHMGALKVFAHETDGVENGSMAFDQKTLMPTYRFQAGIPGSSYAFEIAQRLGIDPVLIAEAKALVGEDRGQVERLILHLEQEVEQAETLRREAEGTEARLAGLKALYEDRVERLKTEGEARKQAIVEEAELLLKEANVTVENLVREIKEKQADQASVKAARSALDTQRQKVSVRKKRQRGPALPAPDLRKGDWVIWQGQGNRGQVVAGLDKSGRVQLEINGLKMRIPAVDLKPAKAPAKKKQSTTAATRSASPDVSTEIDVRGMTGLEAVDLVDKYLSDANMTGFGRVSIIHGKGTGVLRKEITKLLKGHPLVKSSRHGTWREGDTGVTIVELK